MTFSLASELSPMNVTDPLSLLDQPEQEQYLAVQHLDGPEDQEQFHQEFTTAFEQTAQQLASSWGEPDFKGPWDDDDFPEWYDAIVMATWTRPEGTIYLAYQWSGPDVPMLLTLGQR